MTKRKRTLDKENTTHYYIWIIGIIAAIALLVFALTMQTEPQDQPSDQFQKNGDVWEAPITLSSGERVYQFYNHPDNVSDIPYNETTNQALRIVQDNRGKIGISLDEGLINNATNPAFATVASFNIVRFTSPHFGLGTIIGGPSTDFTEGLEQNVVANTTQIEYRPVDCSDANNQTFVIYMRRGEQTSIRQRGYCAIFTAEEERDLLRLADLFTFKTLGVM